MNEKRHELSPLTADEKTTILQGDGWTGMFVAAWKVVLAKVGEDWDKKESIEPYLYQMPKDDWVWCCDRLREATAGSDVTKVNAALEWMNRGPSSY